MDAATIEIAALGRPLHPGMLYDCRNDTFIPGVALWDQESIKNDMTVDPQPHTDVEVAASDLFSEKTKLMKIGTSLQVSFLAGLVQVGGSGSYLADKQSSLRQCRATIKYKQTTEFKQLTMKHLGEVIHPEVFKQQTATHVVTGVQYGAEAVMLFDQTASSEEEKEAIKASLEASVTKIPKVGVGASAQAEMTDEEKEKVAKFSCSFYGDLVLDQNPSTYEEAVQLYKELPKLMGDGSKAVPLRVWLYPLKNLEPTAAQLAREIGVEQVSLVEVLMGQLHEAEIRANDAIIRCQAIKVTDITDKLVKFRNTVAVYAEIFRKTLSKVLPAIRAGTEGEEKLSDILKFHHMSSFTQDKLRKWLDEKESEIALLESYISSLEGCQIIPPGSELNSILFDPNIENVHVYSFTSLANEEPYLTNLSECLACEEFKKMEDVSVADHLSFKEEATPWFNDPQVPGRMRDALTSFQWKLKSTAFFRLLPIMSGKFIISYIPDTSCIGAAHLKFTHGQRQDQTNNPESLKK